MIINDVKQVISEYNSSTLKTYKQYGKYSESSIIKYFKNWSSLMKELNIEPVHKRNISKEDIINDVMKVFDKTDNTTRENYLKHGNYSRAPIIRLFGSWNNMLKELDMNINMNKNIKKEDVLNDVLLHIEKNSNLTAIEYRELGKYSQSVIDRLFGSWTELMKSLNMRTDNRFTTNEEIINDIKRIYSQHGVISSNIIDNECIVSRQTITSRFGSVSKFLDSIGIDTANYNSMSRLQQYMLTFCEQVLGKDYELEKTFDWLRNESTNKKLFIDIYYPTLNLAIEVDGEQHYSRNKWDEDLETIQQRDECKNRLLALNNINLIRLKYNDSKKVILQKLNSCKQ